MKKWVLWGIPAGVFLLFAGLGAYALLFLRIVQVPVGSMANTLIPGDFLLVTRNFGEIRRGDIIVFKFPQDPKVSYLKRVIGLPGDEVQLKKRQVFINGELWPEQRVFIKFDSPLLSLAPEVSREPAPPAAMYRVYYLAQEVDEGEPDTNFLKFAVAAPATVPLDSFFVLGDCRDNSLDSRYWGFVPRANITAKPLSIISSTAPPGQPAETEMRNQRAFTEVK
jgi:signal peptidase I